MSSRAQARFRKTFRYPDEDGDSDSMPEALDEEEQTSLISTLREQNLRINTIYTRLFTAFPLLLTLAYLPPISGLRSTRLPLLAITSLVCTAWSMYFLPAGRTGLSILDAIIANAKDTASDKVKGKRRAGGRINAVGEGGPVQRYLPVMNVCLAGLILFSGILGREEESGEGLGKVRVSMLPALALGVVLGVKIMLGSVDVDELEGLRYGYKGA